MGKLFVIDGTDGSGKQTQFEELKKHFDEDGINYKTVSFPNYDSPSSSLVKMYLSGEFGEHAKKLAHILLQHFMQQIVMQHLLHNIKITMKMVGLY